MKLTHAQRIAFEADEGDALEMRESYSGRGMFGKTTAAITGPDSKRIFEIAEEAGIPTAGFRVDNMGMDWIVY